MINFEIFLAGLLIISTLTGLTTEAIKKILTDLKANFHSNILSGVIAIVLAASVGIAYIIVSGIGFTTPTIIYLVALAFISWLCAMVGYDKVIQVIKQLKNEQKG